MFVPSQYRAPDESWMVELVRRNPLAQLISNGRAAQCPFATHLPVILDPETHSERPEQLSGATLLGHMNRANPQWKALETGTSVLVTFTGAHAYVSPTLYQVIPAAPTWNFTAVHVQATLRKLMSTEETFGVVTATVRAFEAEFGTGWAMTDSLDYFRRILPSVGAFRLGVSGAQGMFKLSQEQAPEIRRRVQRSFAERGSDHHRDIAVLMGRLPQHGARPAGARPADGGT